MVLGHLPESESFYLKSGKRLVKKTDESALLQEFKIMNIYNVCKSILYLIYPLPLSMWIIIAGLFMLLLKKNRKAGTILVASGCGLLLIFSNRFISYQMLGALENRHPAILLDTENIEQYADVKFIVVLGGLLNYQDTLPITSQLNQPMLIRMVESIRLYNAIPGLKLIVSSGGKHDVKEADRMAEFALLFHVNKSDIIIERESDNTFQQAEYIKNIIGNSRFFLVTSARHMPRSYLLFLHRGMRPIPAPTNHLISNDQEYPLDCIIPSTKYLSYSSEAVYEAVALLKEKLFGRI